MNEAYLTVIDRYILLIQVAHPSLKPCKASTSENLQRLSLEHILWMLNKMKDKNFTSKTSSGMWLSWCQSALYLHKLIDPQFEIDITRDICKQYNNFL